MVGAQLSRIQDRSSMITDEATPPPKVPTKLTRPAGMQQFAGCSASRAKNSRNERRTGDGRRRRRSGQRRSVRPDRPACHALPAYYRGLFSQLYYLFERANVAFRDSPADRLRDAREQARGKDRLDRSGGAMLAGHGESMGLPCLNRTGMRAIAVSVEKSAQRTSRTPTERPRLTPGGKLDYQ